MLGIYPKFEGKADLTTSSARFLILSLNNEVSTSFLASLKKVLIRTKGFIRNLVFGSRDFSSGRAHTARKFRITLIEMVREI